MTFTIHLARISAQVEVRFNKCDTDHKYDCEALGCMAEAKYYVNGVRVFASDVMNLIAIERAGQP